MRPVQTGLSNDQQIEITSGVNENETVIVPGTTTAPVRAPGAGGAIPGGGGGFGGPGGGARPGGR